MPFYQCALAIGKQSALATVLAFAKRFMKLSSKNYGRIISDLTFSHSLDPLRKLVTLCVKLAKIGVKVVRHGR